MNQALGGSHGGLSTKVHVRADAKGRPLAFALTGDEAHDLQGINDLLAGWDELPCMILADTGYDADALRECLLLRGVNPIIPLKGNRRERGPLDRTACRQRNWIEPVIDRLRQFRRVATRYDKTASAFLAGLHLAAVCLWLRSIESLCRTQRPCAERPEVLGRAPPGT